MKKVVNEWGPQTVSTDQLSSDLSKSPQIKQGKQSDPDGVFWQKNWPLKQFIQGYRGQS